jgi:hypothetical protein
MTALSHAVAEQDIHAAHARDRARRELRRAVESARRDYRAAWRNVRRLLAPPPGPGTPPDATPEPADGLTDAERRVLAACRALAAEGRPAIWADVRPRAGLNGNTVSAALRRLRALGLVPAAGPPGPAAPADPAAPLPRGVRCAASGRYEAKINLRSREYRLGTHDTPGAAAAAIEAKALEVLGPDGFAAWATAGGHSLRRASRNAARGGYRGVYRTPGGRWEAKLRAGGAYVRCGVHDTPEEAARAHDRRARELLGSAAITNFPPEVNP